MKADGVLFESPTATSENQGECSLAPLSDFQLQQQCAPSRTMVYLLGEIKPLPAIEERELLPTHLQLEPLRACGDDLFDEPVTITDQGFLIDGHKRWMIAGERNISELRCIILSISSEDALLRVLNHACAKHHLNQFCRIELALTLTDPLRLQAKKHQQAGGEAKLLAKLPEAEHIDVRKKTALYAGASEGSVRYAQHLLEKGVIEVRNAARHGQLSIHAAYKLSLLTHDDQIRALKRETSKKCQARRIRTLMEQCARNQEDTRSILLDLLKLATRARSLEVSTNLKARLEGLIASIKGEVDVPTPQTARESLSPL